MPSTWLLLLPTACKLLLQEYRLGNSYVLVSILLQVSNSGVTKRLAQREEYGLIQYHSSFDGSYLFDYPLLLLYNLAFTSLPVMIMGAFDQDLDAKTSMLYPQLYMRGIKGLEYSRTVFWTYMLDGLYQSAIVFFIPYLVYNWSGTATSRGFGQEAIVEMGTTIAASAVITVTLFVAMNNTYHTALMIAILFVSALLFYVSLRNFCQYR